MNFLMPMRMASHKNIKDADEDVEKRELMYTVGRNLNLYSPGEKQGGDTIQQFYFWVYIQKKPKIIIFQKQLHSYVYCRIIYKSQDMKTT